MYERILPDTSCKSVHAFFQKSSQLVRCAGGLWMPHVRCSGSISWTAVAEMRHRWHSAQFFVANVNVNADGTLKANVNRFENDNVWNAENHHRVFLPETCGFLSQVRARVFFSMPIFHPPSILPISFNCSVSCIYWLLGTSLFSQHSCKKNFTPFSFFIARSIYGIFSIGGRNRAVKIDSRSSRK